LLPPVGRHNFAFVLNHVPGPEAPPDAADW